MKAIRSAMAVFTPRVNTEWGGQAMDAWSGQLETLRLKLLSLKPPMSRVQSAGQRRDKANADLAAAEIAAAEAARRLEVARADVGRAAEQVEAAEAELREAGGA
eukprot:11169359-Lingulodinium_polyedra.AAC.1